MLIILLSVVIKLVNSDLVSFLTNVPENVGLNILELVPRHGYNLERHFTTTEDGYILETHRISHPFRPSTNPPILAVQGIASSSIDWISGGANRSLIYALVDLGFDLWLANNRGTKFSRRHITLNPEVDKKEFWDFSFHEMGYYDNPALIDYILETTGYQKLIYLAFSQGTTNFFVMNIDKPEYNEKILFAHLLGPVAYWSNIISPFFRYALPSIERQLVLQQHHIQLYEILPRTVNEMFWPAVCTPTSPFFPICKFMFGFIVGFNYEQLQDDIIPLVTGSLPAGGSLKQYLHYAQLVQNGRFCKFDYRIPEKNVEVYGQSTPPDYDLSKVTVPVIVHYGINDWLLNYKDARKTTSQLPNVIINNQIKYSKFTHSNFMWAKDIFPILYNDIINITLQYAKS